MAILVAITSLSPLSIQIFVPAMPAAAADLGATPGAIQLTVTLYLFAVALGQLVYGPLSDRFGRRPVLLLGLLVYVTAAVFAALAASAGALIAARVFQALGACSGMVLGRAMVRDGSTVTESARRLALLSFALSVAPAAAPVIGGYISAWVGWRGVFAVLAGCGAAVLSASLLVLPESNQARIDRIDVGSMIRTYASLLRSRLFVAFTICGTFNTASFYGFVSASPFLLTDMLRQSQEAIGVYYMIIIGSYAFGSMISGRLAGRISGLRAMVIGTAINLASMLGLFIAAHADAVTVLALIGPVALLNVAAGILVPFAISGAIGTNPTTIGAAAGLYGSIHMAYGGICTLLAGSWHDGTARPVATIMFVSVLIAAGALIVVTRPQRPPPGT